jgi:uncharacterized membrane protein HdeD (DUF308 family)
MENLTVNWWALVIRGVAALIFGLVALLYPPGAVAALVILFGAWALTDGIFNVIAAVREARTGRRWGALLVEGIISIVAGVVTFFLPALTALALVLWIAAWSLLTGIAEIVAAIRLRRVIRNEWLLGLTGVLSVALGVLFFLFPGAAALTVAVWVGAYAVVFGALLTVLGFRLKSWTRSHERHLPTEAVAQG